MDEWSGMPFENLTYTEVKIGDPYEVETSFFGALPGLLTLFVILAPFIIRFIVVVFIIWVIVKWTKIRRRKKVI